MNNGKTQVFTDPGLLPEKTKIYQCIRCHAIFILSEPEDVKEIASWKTCCGIPFIIPLSVEELEYGDSDALQKIEAN